MIKSSEPLKFRIAEENAGYSLEVHFRDPSSYIICYYKNLRMQTLWIV